VAEKYKIIGEVRGLGAMLGLALSRARREPAADEAKKLAAFCLERGLIILVCGTYSNVVRVLVPFVITDEQLEKGLQILEDGISSISN
jgi:4-aminobutyrate aminotransferase / (S)-3-amino-2-methylpropionate transaminase / 5-aminovalerate transaminase